MYKNREKNKKEKSIRDERREKERDKKELRYVLQMYPLPMMNIIVYYKQYYIAANT